MPNYKSFDDVLRELDLDEDELKRLVSEGQIRAFRDDDRMKFRSEDVQSLARHRVPSGPGDIDLGETQLGGEGLEIIEEETDETLLDLGNLNSDADFEDTGATSVPTVELSDIGEDQDATLTEELVFDETDELGGLDFGDEDADATQKIEGGLDLSNDDELGLQTEPVDSDGLDELDELDDVGVAAGPEEADVGGGYQYAQAPMGMPGPVQIQEQVKYVEIVPNEGIAWKVLTGVTFILVLLLGVTAPAMGMVGGRDVLGDFWGGTAYSLYMKGPNQAAEITQSTYSPKDPNAVPAPEPFSAGAKPTQVVWPGMPIVRNVEGASIDSGTAAGAGE
ncbi:MAG: hypothetical protein IPK87_06855 [Planctomycetes bacterium]|nr:hypothetical protein [Planctomycetota bacterium]